MRGSLSARHQIKQKAIRQDGLFALEQKKAGCDAGASYPTYEELRRV
ncbi:hypothetical protein HCN62_05845 [Escherichia coli]|nr:hypothetical protein [Escherichia coli]MBI9903169.1 hypothetical protein [Escherichia coli]NMR40699.1 hypothetical protein [Escherichia coli]